MLELDEQELEEEQWHEKINHEDQAELFTAAAEVEPEAAPEEIKEPGQENPLNAGTDTNQKQAPIPPHGTDAPLHEVWIPRIRKFLENPTNRYATMAVGLGVLVGVIVAAITWYASNPDGRYDLGPVTSDAVGLRGRLFVKWDDKLHYRLVFEPSYPDQIPGFSLAAGNPPRPLSISIQLRDVQGFELCSKDVVLRFDPKRAEALAPVPRGGEAEAASSAAPAPATAPDAAADAALQAQQQAQLQAQQQAQQDAIEAARERGKDVFELQAGPSGQIVAINAQGDLPCSQKNYTSAISWTFVPDFPSIAEQKELLKRLQEREEYAEKQAFEAAHPSKKKAKKPTANAVVFYIEGDDTIDDYDSAMGVISTRGRKSFSIDRSGAEAAALRNSEFPMGIHYRCDQMGNCTISSSHAGLLHGRLRR
jgi:hypothetical protein